MGLHWRAVGGVRTGLRVEEYDRNYLVEMARAAVICECVGAQLLEI